MIKNETLMRSTAITANEKKGETNLEDIATIRAEVEQRHQVEPTDQTTKG